MTGSTEEGNGEGGKQQHNEGRTTKAVLKDGARRTRFENEIADARDGDGTAIVGFVGNRTNDAPSRQVSGVGKMEGPPSQVGRGSFHAMGPNMRRGPTLWAVSPPKRVGGG